MAAEMGLKPREIDECTLAEFNIMYTGYVRRREDDWDIARRTWAYVVQFGGMGLKNGETVEPEKMWHLRYRDNEKVKLKEREKITTFKQAQELLQEFS